MTDTKPRILWLGVIFLLFLSLSLQAQKGFNMNEKEMVRDFKFSNTQYLKAEKLFKKGKTGKSVTALKKCLEIFPKHDKAHFLLANILLKQRKLKEAETEILAAKEGFNYLQKWYSYTFQEYMDRLRDRRAANDKQISNLEMAKASASQSQKALYENQIQQLKNENSSADSKLSEFLRSGVEMPASYHYTHGNIYFLTRRFREAFREYELTLEKDPKHGGACNNMANIYFIHKRYDKAREYLDRATQCGAEINPKFRAALEKAEGK